MDAQTLGLGRLIPEISLTVTAIAVLLTGVGRRGGSRGLAYGLTAIGVAVAAAALLVELRAPAGSLPVSIGLAPLRLDGLALFFKLLVTLGLVVVLLFSWADRRLRTAVPEYLFLLVSAVLGIFFLVSTENLLLLYLGLELLSLASYVLAGYLKTTRKSSEAALKYILFGAVATGMMIFAFSILYGLAGSLELRAIGRALAAPELATFQVPIGILLVLVLVGLGYKIASVPFHFWCPDVYEGSPTPITSFLAVVSKAAGFAMLLRVLEAAFPEPGLYQNKLAALLALVAAVTMTFGNLAALRQDNLKRLLAYSSIAHAGYLLMGAACFTRAGDEAMLFYLVVYLFMNLGAFGIVIYFANAIGSEDIKDYRGLGWVSPLAGAMLVVFLLSLTGIPPTGGFVGKVRLFQAAIDAGLAWLAVLAAINSVVSLFYYFRIVKAMFLVKVDPPPAAIRAQPILGILLGLLAFATIQYGVFFGPLLDLSGMPFAGR